MVTVGDDPLLGVVVEGRYKIESVIGQGSAGTVYKAIQELIGREVAIKVLHDYLVSDQEFIKRFTQEAKASSRLSHPNIITIYDFGTIPQGNRPYIAMDLLKGTPLSDLLGERNHLSVEETIPLFKQVCGALAEAHKQGVVHRDVKPENIVLVERSAQKLYPIVVDFGIARLVQEESDVARITRTGTVCGSPTYMSPEQCTSSKVDHRSDIYSLGVVIYETLTGEVPFLSDELVKVMAMHLSDPPKPLNSVRDDLQFSDALEEVVYKSLAKNPDQRFQTMEEFAEALVEAGKASEAPPAVIAPIPAKPRDLAPGPLAQDDDLRQHRASKDIRSASKEVAIPQRAAKIPDLASRALEELRTSGAYNEVDAEVTAATIQAVSRAAVPDYHQSQRESTTTGQALSRANFQRGRKQDRGLLNKVGMKGVLLATVLIVVAAIVGLARNNNFHPVLPWNRTSINDVDTLYKQGKYQVVINTVKEFKSNNNNQMPRKFYDTFGKALIQQAKIDARDKDYDTACSLLEQVPIKSTFKDQANKDLKRYLQIKQEEKE